MRPYMTEGEAGGKTCPLVMGQAIVARVLAKSLTGNALLGDLDIYAACNGPKCAWWGMDDGTVNCEEGDPGARFAGTYGNGTKRYIRQSHKGRCEAPGGSG